MRTDTRKLAPFAIVGSLAFLAFASPAEAQTRAIVTVDLNMRAGPGTEYPVVNVLNQRTRATIHGCVRNFSWCDVTARGDRGWVSARYLAIPERNRPVVELGPAIGLPIISFQFGYWDRHYSGRRFYRERDRWFDRRETRSPREERPPRREGRRTREERETTGSVEGPRWRRDDGPPGLRGEGPPGLRGELPPGLRENRGRRGNDERGPRRERRD